MCRVIAVKPERRRFKNNNQYQFRSSSGSIRKKSGACGRRSAGAFNFGIRIPKKDPGILEEYDGKYHHGYGV